MVLGARMKYRVESLSAVIVSWHGLESRRHCGNFALALIFLAPTMFFLFKMQGLRLPIYQRFPGKVP
jgi:hypothetical protein